MNRWACLVLAATTAAVIGCGGGGNGGGGGGGGGTTGPQSAVVNTALLNGPGTFEVTYNTGQGRAPGSPTAVIRRFSISDNIGVVETTLASELRMQLDGYTSHSLSLSVPMSGFSQPIASRLFETFPLDVQAIEIEQFGGGTTRYTGPGGAPILNELFAMNARVFPGRTTAVQIFLDDATLNYDEGLGQVIFDRQRFEDINYDPVDLRINSHIGDMVMFDISNVANKPQFDGGTGPEANRVYFTGDVYGISIDPTIGGAEMEVLTAFPEPIEALVSPQGVGGINSPGTYTIKQLDPRVLPPDVAYLTALQGIWRPYTDSDPTKGLLLNVGTFDFITFPNSTDGATQDLVMFARDASGNIIDMYFGEVDFASLTFAAWPIDQIDDGDASNEVNGDIFGVVYRPGIPSPTFRDIRFAQFVVTSGTVPATFLTSGRVLVVRL